MSRLLFSKQRKPMLTIASKIFSKQFQIHCKKKYCWFNLKNEVTWLPENFKFIELEKVS